MSIGKKIRMKRAEMGLSQREFAKRAGIKANVLSNIENGHVRKPHTLTISRLAKTLKVKPEWLMEEEV